MKMAMSHSIWERRPLWIGVCLVSLWVTSPALAQTETNTAAARALFGEGRACAEAEDYVCAADRWRRSFALRPSPVVAYNLALAEQELGHLVVSAELLAQIERMEDAAGPLREAASALRAEIESQLARVTFVVGTDDSEVAVTLDGRELPREVWGMGIPVSPGDHEVVARHGESVVGRDSFSVQAGEETTRRLVIVLPSALGDGPTRRRRRILGGVLGGVAAVALVVVIVAVTAGGQASPSDSDLPVVEFP